METIIRVVGNNIVVRVHLDPAKVLEDGKPDPAWVAEYTWGASPNEGQTLGDHIDSCKRESLGLAEVELQKRLPPRGVNLMGG